MKKHIQIVAISFSFLVTCFGKVFAQEYFCVGYNIPCNGPADICTLCDDEQAGYPHCNFQDDCDFPALCISTLCEQRLAVELSSFSIKVVGDIINLSWTTASEVNHAGFAIEYSLDAEVYHEIDWVHPKPEKEYKYSYLARSSGIQHVRLKSHEYSQVLTVQVGIPEKQHILKASYPNPFNHNTFVDFIVEQGAPFEISIMDMTGRFSILKEGVSNGAENRVSIGSGLTPGRYLVKLKTPTSSSMISIVKL